MLETLTNSIISATILYHTNLQPEMLSLGPAEVTYWPYPRTLSAPCFMFSDSIPNFVKCQTRTQSGILIFVVLDKEEIGAVPLTASAYINRIITLSSISNTVYHTTNVEEW